MLFRSGNRHDWVGRCFMEHPHGRVGVFEAGAGFELWAAFQRHRSGDAVIAPVLLPDEHFQRRHNTLNSAFTFKLQRHPPRGLSASKKMYNRLRHDLDPTRGRRALWHLYRGARRTVQRTIRKPLARFRFARDKVRVNVMVRAEQAPNRDSRITLSPKRDALGVPQSTLDWRMSMVDKRSVRIASEGLARSFEAAGMGRMHLSEWLYDDSPEWPLDLTVGNHAIAGYHHIGTTRMSQEPEYGVVDPDCRVHGYDNLFVAGSSVFPTSSWANPTLTLLALAYRLADHLNEQTRSNRL